MAFSKQSAYKIATSGLEPEIVWPRRKSVLPDFGIIPSADICAPKKTKVTSFFHLFRYSTVWERVQMVFTIILATLSSIGVPYNTILYGEFTSLLIDRSVGTGTSSPTYILNLFGGGRKLTDASKDENMQAIRDDASAYGVASMIGVVVQLILTALAINLQNRIALNQIGRIRNVFLESILRQEMSWYDTCSDNSFASKMTEDLDKMKDGMGEKVVIFTFLIMTFVTGVVFSFVYGWELTSVVLICCPFIILSTALVAKIQSSLTVKELDAYSGAGAVAEEVFGGIRTVLAFSGERKETERYAKLLTPAEDTGRKKGTYSGLGAGIMWLIIYVSYALTMWYGVKLILADRGEEMRHYTPAVLVIVLFGIIMGAQNLGFSTPHLEAFATAKGAAQNVFSIIDRMSAVDPIDEKGLKPDEVAGNIEFNDLHFHYPARPDIQILRGLSVKVKAGQTVAFVGASGCGKSTCLQLMQRFYDPLKGSVELDGYNLKKLNVSWLRAQIGVVGQEPVLFATTIAENIRRGNPAATLREIEAAARMANCHDFISKLPKRYDTMVGERGAQMSGGQKQRIAIARALIRNPKILLLDEPTSALDPTSERRVQDALDVASKGRTTLVVSHRLSTITNADKIVFVKEGVVVEEGTHKELMAAQGHYYDMVNITRRKEKSDIEDGDMISKPFTPRQTEVLKDDDSESSSEEEEEEQNDTTIGGVLEPKISRTGRKKKEKYKVSMWQIIKLNAPEWKYILCGSIAAMLHGSTFPMWAVLFGDFFAIMSDPNPNYVQSQTTTLSIIFIVIGVIAGLGTFIQTYMFNVAGVKMTSRLRQRAFTTIINQEVAFFDSEDNSVGALCSRLAGDCSNVQGATGVRIGIIVQSLSTLIIGVVIAFYFSWNLTLVTLITIPFVCLSILFEARFMEGSAYAEKLAIEKASQVAVEAISNIRTVASLGQEKKVVERYSQQISKVNDACQKKLRFRGVVFGFGQVAPFIAYAICLYYGGSLVANNGLPYAIVIKVSEALIFGSWMLGQALAFAPNASAAILSARRLMRLFNRVPTTQTSPTEKRYTVKEEESIGDITYENVDFHYPNRKDIPILRDLNLSIEKGKTVALVGPSGSGKSTCVQLLLRYYDPVQGHVKLNGTPTTEFSLDSLRSKMGLVSQEPVLFDRTIAENIAYGDNFREDVPMAEIIAAAKKANIHNFILSLPRGYFTSLGNKGAQLSGGQKQRIAIARALVRNPKILILDEATSALDLESEKVVQEALNIARSGRTCVTIAHRLTTVQDADLICVLKKGIVVERGTHRELLEQNGIYAELYWLQQVA